MVTRNGAVGFANRDMGNESSAMIVSSSNGRTERPLRSAVVTNIYPTPATPDLGTFVADRVASLRAAGVLVDLLHLRRAAGGRRVYTELPRRITRFVQSTKPDVVHVMYGGVMADIITRTVRDVPVIVSFCGTDLLGGTGKGLIHTVARRYGVVASRRAAARAAGIIVMSPNLFKALPRGLERSRVWIVPDGVDLACFGPRDKAECRAALGWDPERRHVLFPASPSRPEKRFALARAAVDLLRGDGVDFDLHVLAGVPHAEVATWLNASDVLLLTSAHEGSPNVVKEALACDVSVVSVDVGDVRERIEGIDGCFVAEPTPEDIGAKVAQAVEREQPTAGREHVEEFALERLGAKLCEIYATVTSDRVDRNGTR